MTYIVSSGALNSTHSLTHPAHRLLRRAFVTSYVRPAWCAALRSWRHRLRRTGTPSGPVPYYSRGGQLVAYPGLKF